MEMFEKLMGKLQTGQSFTLQNGRSFIALPPGVALTEVTHKRPPPVEDRIIEQRQFHDGDSLSEYCKRYLKESSLMLADADARVIKVLLDYHDNATEGEGSVVDANDHSASWRLRYSQEYKAWADMEAELHDQAEFIRFLEENAADIVRPDAAALLDLCRDFSAIKQVSFRSSRRLDNGDRELLYTEETGTKTGISIPQKLFLRLPVFLGEEPVELTVLFRHRINDGRLKLGFEFHRAAPIVEAAFRQAATRVAESTGLTALYGA